MRRTGAEPLTPSLRAFTAYRVFSRLYFHLAIIFPYLWLGGLSLPVVAAALAAYGLAITFVAPVAPRLLAGVEERWAILAGEILKAAGLATLVVWPTVGGAIAGQAVGGVGYALTAGPDTRLLRALCRDGQSFDRVQANTQSYMFLSILVSGVAGALLFTVDPILPFAATLAVAPLAVAALLVAARGADPDTTPAPVAASQVRERRPRRLTPRTMFWVDYYAIARGILLGVYLGLLPYLFFLVLRVDVAWFGPILGSFTLLAFLAARRAIPLSERLGVGRLTVASIALMVVGLGLLAATESIAVSIVAMGLLGIANGGVRPLTLSNLSRGDVSPAEQRRALAVMEQRTGILNVVVILLGGLLIGLDVLSFQELMAITIGAYAAVMAVVFLVRYHTPRRAGRTQTVETGAAPMQSTGRGAV